MNVIIAFVALVKGFELVSSTMQMYGTGRY